MQTIITVTLKRDKECKGSVRFATDDEKAPVTNVYVSRTIPWVAGVQVVTLTVAPVGLSENTAGRVLAETVS